MILLADDVWAETLNWFRRCGADRKECVVYWTGPRTAPSLVDEVVHPTHTATFASYEIESNWLHSFWVDLRQRQRSVRVQVHTHSHGAFHSATDDLWPIVHAPGFLSLVLPRFGRRFGREDLYLAEIDVSGQWVEANLDERISGVP